MKKLVSVLTIAAVMLTSVLAFASADTAETADGQLTPMPAYDSSLYNKQVIQGQLAAVHDGQLIITADSEYAINTDENTLFINDKCEQITIDDIKEGDTVKTIASSVSTRSLPPQSYGYIVMASEEEYPAFPLYAEVSSVTEDEEALTFASADGEYEIYVLDATQVTDLTGNKLSKNDIKEGTQLLFNTQILTLSIPAKGTADSVILLDTMQSEMNEAREASQTEPESETVTDFDKVVVDGQEVNAKVISKGEILFIPVRATCEAMGYEVEWSDLLMAVTVGTDPMGVNFRIGENSYNKVKMTPFTLSAAPELINDLTYVPLDFYAELLDAQVSVVDGVVNITCAQN